MDTAKYYLLVFKVLRMVRLSSELALTVLTDLYFIINNFFSLFHMLICCNIAQN
jgi:hypothetical protein